MPLCIYIYLCIYGLIYLCEGLATKWASNPTFEKPDPFINRPLDIYVCVSVRVYLLIRIAIYLAICWLLALSMYVCLYVYIQLCIYRFFYLSEGLTTKWASTPTFDKPEPFSKRPFKIYVCIDLRVGVTCEREMKRTNPMHGHTQKIQLAIAKDPLYRKNQQTMCIQDPTHIFSS